MKKFLSKISVVIVAAFMLITAVGCSYLEGLIKTPTQKPTQTPTTNLPKLPSPEVTIDGDGVASWEEVDYAIYYAYVIDDGSEKLTDECCVQLAENQSVTVKAVSGSPQEYADSDFSETKTYVKGSTPPIVVPPDGCTHTDANKDGKCDKCGNSVKAELSFYAVNDLHGKFMDNDSQPGVDEFTTYLKNLYKDTTREEILLSSGDMWQGTVESSSNKGQLMTEWMNDVGFVSMTLGNHEYDWGPDVLTPNSKLAKFPFLAINVKFNGSSVNYCQASTTVEKGGVKIGIIGAIGDCLKSISGEFKDGLSFATGDALTKLVKDEATRLRNNGCDFIVYSIHDGYSPAQNETLPSTVKDVTNSDMGYYDTDLSDGYVDLVFEGHSHQRYMFKDEYGVYHLQGGGENNNISCAEVSYNIVTDEYTVTPSIISKSVYASSSIKDDPIVDTLYTKYFPDSDPYTEVLGTNTSKKYSSTICDKVAQLYYEKGKAEWGNQYDIVLGGGFLKARSPYNLDSGNVTYAKLFSILPFDNDIVLGRISGTYLKSQFLETSNTDYHIYVPQSITVDESKIYYIVVDTYSSTYSYNHITEVKRIKGTYARDLLADYVSKGGWGSGTKSTAYLGNLSQDFKSITGYAL